MKPAFPGAGSCLPVMPCLLLVLSVNLLYCPSACTPQAGWLSWASTRTSWCLRPRCVCDTAWTRSALFLVCMLNSFQSQACCITVAAACGNGLLLLAPCLPVCLYRSRLSAYLHAGCHPYPGFILISTCYWGFLNESQRKEIQRGQHVGMMLTRCTDPTLIFPPCLFSLLHNRVCRLRRLSTSSGATGRGASSWPSMMHVRSPMLWTR